MQWKLFKYELPELNRLILYGNHRFLETAFYHPDNERIKLGKMHYKDITHWCYIEPPDCYVDPEEERKW